MASYFSEPKLKLPKKDYSKGDLPDTKEGWVAYTNDIHDRGLRVRRPFEFQWVINVAYYLGYQHLLYNARSGSIEIPVEYRQPLTINRIASFIEARQAKITKNRPVTRVMPNSDDQDDRNAAKYSDQALMNLWRKTDMEQAYDKLTMLMLLCGSSFMETLWDPYQGDTIRDYKKSEDGQDLIMDDDGLLEEEDIFLGEVSSQPLSPLNVIPANFSLSSVKDQEYILIRKHVPLIELWKLYPHLRDKLVPESEEARFTLHERQLMRLGSSLFSSIGTETDIRRDSLNVQALVKCLLIKPNIQYPQGIACVIAGKELAAIDVWPNNYGKNVYPLVRFHEKETGMHFFPPSTVERLIPINRAYNRLKQQKVKNAYVMANGKWLLPKGSQVPEDALTDEEGEVLEYNPALPKPEQAAIAPLPNYVTEVARELIVDFRDVGGQRESSMTPPPNLTAGVALETFAEQTDEIMGPLIQRIARSMSLVANTQLTLMNEEYDDPRKIYNLGDDGKSSVIWLAKTDLRNHTSVHVEVESLFPDLRGRKRQSLLDLWDRRVITDPKMFLRAYRFGNFDEIIDKEEKLQDSIYLDIQMIKKGKQPEIHPFQNHLMYVQKLSDFAQTPEFLRLIPERKELFLQNLQAHLQLIMQSLPGGGEPLAQQNQNSVGTPFGSQVPVGTQGNGA